MVGKATSPLHDIPGTLPSAHLLVFCYRFVKMTVAGVALTHIGETNHHTLTSLKDLCLSKS